MNSLWLARYTAIVMMTNISGGKRAVQWCLALVGASALLLLHAPALLCFASAVSLAWWWCKELDADAGSDAK